MSKTYSLQKAAMKDAFLAYLAAVKTNDVAAAKAAVKKMKGLPNGDLYLSSSLLNTILKKADDVADMLPS